MKARVIGGTLRDLSYIAANLRPDDKAEIDCQCEAWKPAQLALAALQGHAYVVTLDGNPEAAFGATEQRTGLWIIWSWGSRRMWRTVPTITKFCMEVVIPDVLNAGAMRGEARAMASNQMAVRWLERLGATRQGVLRNFGKNGEDFLLFEWVRSKDWPTSAIVNRPGEVFEALAPGLHPPVRRLDDASSITTCGVSPPMF